MRVDAGMIREAGARGNEPPDDDVFLQAAQIVLEAPDRASVSTRVVSWKEAAEMKDSVAREALVIPNNMGSHVDWFLPRPSASQ